MVNANLVANGGFETGDLTGWSIDNGAYTGVTNDPAYVHSSAFGLYYGWIANGNMLENHLFQTLATTAGDTYTLSFWYNIHDGAPNELTAFVGTPGQCDASTTVFDAVNPPPTNQWVNVMVNFTATSNATGLAFGMRQDPGYSALDDISVNPAGAVPEPCTMLLGVGAIGAAAARSRAKSGK